MSKANERIKTINLGGSAAGTALAVPRYFVFEAPRELAHIAKLPLTRSENLPDATANLDPLVEAHAILKAHAVNIEKMSSDLRLLASDLVARGEMGIPEKQVGSSIMPGKINPVIPEYAISAAHRVYTNDDLIASLSGRGCLDLNAYLPAIGHAYLESLKLLIACDATLTQNLLAGIEVRSDRSTKALLQNPAITAALIPYIGYRGAERAAYEMKENGLSIVEANRKLGLVTEAKLERILTPDALLSLGYSIEDLTEEGSK